MTNWIKMQNFLSALDNLVGTPTLAFQADISGSPTVIQSGKLHRERKTCGWFGIFLKKECSSRICVYQMLICF